MPTGPIHPGEVLKDEIVELGLSAKELARKLGVPAVRVTDIVGRRSDLTADMALPLSRYFGTTPEFWMNLQSRYALECARRDVGRQITKIRPRRAA
ncbi:MAG: addiction module antidote protein, HigA family [Alphaproteobacteria bacterium]|nr:addiction module antidote protein, HigA family [Alphaproteobacteria bacterium]